jgi:PhnB protein
MTVKKIPPGYEGATPYICCKGAADAIDFYKRAFGATELFRMPSPAGTIAHAEIRIGSAIIMLADEHPQLNFLSPKTLGGSPVSIYIYTEDVDALAKRATAAGARITKPLQDQFYGDRSVGLECPFGHKWGFATHVEDVPPDELERRAKKMFGGA